jgi:transcriptional regulator with XRE-family HTH domain
VTRSGVVSETDRLLGRRLWQERRLAGHGLQAFAATLGLSQEQLADCEAGRRRIGPAAMAGASEALGVPLSVLFCSDDHGLAVDCAEDDAPERIAVARPLGLMRRPAFAPFAPFLELWRTNRGRMPHDLGAVIANAGLRHRALFACQLPRSTRFTIEHLGAGIEMFRPCETLLLVGRELTDMTDREYGAWVADTYARTLAEEQPVLESVRATIRVTDDRVVEGRYDRFLLPWSGAGGDRFVLCLSLTQTSRVVEG